jgi:hypothetical protein
VILASVLSAGILYALAFALARDWANSDRGLDSVGLIIASLRDAGVKLGDEVEL